MKKVISIFVLCSFSFFLFGFSTQKIRVPNSYYKVYLDDEELGMIESKKELEDYIDQEGEAIKKELGVKKVYPPNGLEIKKVTTYKNDLSSVKDIYKKIEKKKPFTVKGYQFTIKHEKSNTKIFVLDKNVFKEALENVIESFVGTEKYTQYLEGTQKEIEDVGSIIENIYIEESITTKETYISVEEKIYQDESELSQYLLFGSDPQTKIYEVKANDTLDSAAFNNQISVEDILIANPELSSTNALLYTGQKLKISYLKPQVTVVVESHDVKDVESEYKVEERYDENKLVGDDEVIQKGEKGLERVTQNVRTKNGITDYINFVSKEELKPVVNEIVVKGQKVVPSVGTLTNWQWPTISGWTITSNYAYRYHPISGRYQLHPALDIAGLPYGSNIYASNNGVVTLAKYYGTYGNCVIINHNNGYYTLYAHLSSINVRVGQVVSKGSVIGKLGMTGSATGPHLHYELWVGGAPHGGGTNINPWTVHR